jgi:hypothetical protein
MKYSFFLVMFALVLAVAVLMHVARKPVQPYDWRTDPQVWNYHREELNRIYSQLGTSPRQILGKEKEAGRARVFGALQTLCSWKKLNGAELNEVEHFVLIVPGLGAEVNNGGFHQYFFNSTADDWEVMLEGMRQAGDEAGVRKFEAVLQKFPGGSPSTDRKERQRQLDSFGDRQYVLFASEDDAFYGDPFPDWDKTWAYISNHIDQIQPLEFEPERPPSPALPGRPAE